MVVGCCIYKRGIELSIEGGLERDVSQAGSKREKVTFDSLNSTSLSLEINRLLIAHRVHCTGYNQSKFQLCNQSI